VLYASTRVLSLGRRRIKGTAALIHSIAGTLRRTALLDASVLINVPRRRFSLDQPPLRL
jgi:hypothetical protein